MNDQPAAAVLDSVSKSFGEHLALADISLRIPGGQVMAIVGESGSGKSTLLEHLNGLHKPDTGRIEILGQQINYTRLVQLRRQVGYAVQGVGLFPHLSATDNVALPAQLSGWNSGQIDKRRQRLMQLMELKPELGDRYPHQLSGGQQQRFGLCRAMMLQPRLLLLDEPFSGVDPITRQGIHEGFLQLQENEPTTVVLVTHDLREARKLSRYLVIIRAGRIVQSGPTEELIAAPVNEYVASLLREHLQ